MKFNNKEALDLVRSMVANGHITQDIAEKYFPELKESEGERIRKEILDCAKAMKADKWIAWLEKQGEKMPAWSEEDGKMLDTVIEDLIRLAGPKVCYHKDVNWLKSLKDRVQPQNTWKPSNEQITWLYRAADDASKDSRMKQVLNNLLSDLKKLREE